MSADFYAWRSERAARAEYKFPTPAGERCAGVGPTEYGWPPACPDTVEWVILDHGRTPVLSCPLHLQELLAHSVEEIYVVLTPYKRIGI